MRLPWTVQPPTQDKADPEVQEESFFPQARTKQNPSGPGLGSISNTEKKPSEPPSVRLEIERIRTEQKEKARSQKEEPQRSKASPEKFNQHQQPPNSRKPKSRKEKER